MRRIRNSSVGRIANLARNLMDVSVHVYIVYKSREKFERKDNEVGLINIDDRNREIDEAIEMLRREDYA